MNRLAAETSPYLLQHAANPVDWRVWGPEALAEAAAQNKPILLSIGYAACHWCHVMAHESFENPAIAAQINQLFVPIKLDREERPDLDAIYQHALALLGKQGGWPLTMFLTPQAAPFWGGTYFPPEPRWGRPGFPQILEGVARAYQAEPGNIAANVRALTDGLARHAQPQRGGDVDPALLDRAAARLADEIDLLNGGFGSAPKFPQCSALTLIWRGSLRTGNPVQRDAVLLTLDRMSQGGIYDHLGGGFSRYATDDAWLIPHFEKMLYDNAQLIELLTFAHNQTGKPLYQTRVSETVTWLLREMRRPEGAFAAALDADSEHVEGKFYVWQEAEIDALLGAEAPFFKANYDVTPHGNWEHSTILHRSAAPDLLDETGESRLAAARAILCDARAIRIRPGLDHKILADWNGMAIAALTRAAQVFSRPDWLQSARDAFTFVSTAMQTPDGRLLHSWCDGRTHPGTLDDHTQMIRAALLLFQATGNAAYLAHVTSWLAVLNQYFRAEPAAPYSFTPADATDLLVRLTPTQDGPVPSGNGTMVENLATLFHLTGDDRHRSAAEDLIHALSGELARNLFGMASFLGGVDTLYNGRHIVAQAGQGANPREAWRYLGPGDLITIAYGAEFPPSHPAHGKKTIDGQTTFYICQGQSCSAPTTDPAAIRPASA